MTEIKHPIVFYYTENEHMPFLLGYGHNLKEKNLFICNSSIVSESEDDLIVKKTISKEDINMTITILYKNNRFHNGSITVSSESKLEIPSDYTSSSLNPTYNNNQEYKIMDINMYHSLQIESYCYDNIGVIKLDYETGNKLFNKN
jgi:hypothetical protein